MQKKHDRLENFYSLDSRKMAKSCVFEVDNQGSWIWRGASGEAVASIKYEYQIRGLVLSYHANSRNYRYLVPISTTPCNYGGVRYWFNCPNCQKRVAKLYFKQSMFYCRSCHALNYATQQDTKLDSTRLVMYRLRDKLGWEYDSVLMPIWKQHKPKGMHRTTFNRLVLRHDQLDHKQNKLSMQSFKSFMDKHGFDY